MSLTALLNQPVTLHQRSPGAEDEHGNPADVEATVATVGFISQQAASELGPEGVQQESYRLFLPAGTPVTGWDAATVDGTRFEIDGPPWPVFNPRTKTVHHVEATIRRAA